MPQFRRLVPLVMNVVGAESTTETPPPESPLSARKTSNHYSRTTTSWPARRPPRPARHFRQHARRVLAAHRHGELAPGETHRSLGEFGATILVAGNRPGRTTTFPVAVYQAVQAGEDSHAWTMAGVSIVIAFATVFASESCLRRCG